MSTTGNESESSVLPIDAFYDTVNQLANVLKSIVTDVWEDGYRILDPAIIDAGLSYMGSKYSKEDVITTFISYSAGCWDMILAKNEEFFKKEAWSLFKDIPEIAVKQFYNLFTMKSPDNQDEYVIGTSDREILWEYFFTMVRISLTYIHEGRQPRYKLVEEDGKKKQVAFYLNKQFFPQVDINYHCKNWKIHRRFVLDPQTSSIKS